MKQRTYIAIDLKSFYASVECRERGLDPLDTNLVVADESRTDKTICLAVTPSLKSYGISGRGRLFEVKQRVKEANAGRRHDAPGRRQEGSSYLSSELQANPELAIDFIIAPPRMAYYMEYSTHIYSVYMRYVAPEDIVVYSIDKVFMDVTDYLNTYKLSPRDLAMKIILDVLETTGITATAGIGTNLFLCKVAMDIVAKHIPADENGVRIAELNEETFRRTLWKHQPLTDFWRVGRGYAKKLEENGMFTMGDVARCSVHDEDKLYKLFGKNAELLIDHAWGWEPCTINAIKAYKPSTNSLGSGQVLHCPYKADKAKLVLSEMADSLVLDLVSKGLVTDQIVVTVGYDIENLIDPRLTVFIGLFQHGVLPVDHIPGLDFVHAFTSEIRKDFSFDNALLHFPSAEFDAVLHILFVKFVERLKCHIEVSCIFKKEVFLPFGGFTLGLKPTLHFAVRFAFPVGISCRDIPGSIFVFVNSHLIYLLGDVPAGSRRFAPQGICD
jgi:DNA polymerase V